MFRELYKNIRPSDEPAIDTAKRIAGAAIILSIASPVPNKEGWTVPFALYMSDTIGPPVRTLCTKALMRVQSYRTDRYAVDHFTPPQPPIV